VVVWFCLGKIEKRRKILKNQSMSIKIGVTCIGTLLLMPTTPANAQWVTDGTLEVEVITDYVTPDSGDGDANVSTGAINVQTSMQKINPEGIEYTATAYGRYKQKYKWEGTGTSTSSFTVNGSAFLHLYAQAADGNSSPPDCYSIAEARIE
jgi:hypothetical protein